MPPFHADRSASRHRAALPATAFRFSRLARLATAAPLYLAALLCAGPSAAGAQGEEIPQPKLTVEERVYTTGEIPRDQEVEHTFKIRNSGGAALSIHEIVEPPNLEIVSAPTALAPGGRGEIRVRVPLLYEKAGALLKQIQIRSNDPVTPELVLELKIFSIEYVVAKPGYARWIAVQQEKRGTISQRLAATDGQDFQVLRTGTLPPGITATFAEAKKEAGSQREWNVDLTLGEDAPVGAIVGTLLIHVKHPKQSIVPIPLSGFMRPVVAVTPDRVSAGELKLPEKRIQAFIVKSFSTEPVHVTSVEHDLKGFPPATLETRTVGREYKVRLEFDPATMPKGALRGTLKIHTDSPKVPLLSVPIEGTVP